MSKRKKKLQGEIGSFLQQYQRKKYPSIDPNDRHYDRGLESKIKRMNPVELSEFISGDGTDMPDDIDELWFSFETIPGVKFKLNQPVEIVKGEYSGLSGSTISLLSITPEPRYLVELSSGKDINVLESQLKGL